MFSPPLRLRVVLAATASACTNPAPPARAHVDPAAPTLLGPGVVSTADPEFALAITADGSRIYFNRLDATRSRFELLTSERRANGWSVPAPVWFAAPPARDVDPFLSYDGRELFFSSNRPRPGSTATDFNLWRVGVAPGAAPTLLPDTINTDAMEVYGGFDRAGRFVFARTIGDATRVLEVDSLEDTPRDVAPSVPASLTNPALSPDGRLLIVASTELPGYGGADLFVLHRDGNAWSEPYNLGPGVNGPYAEFAPSFSPDQRTLYFTSERIGVVGPNLPSERRPGDLYSIPVPVALGLPRCAGLGPVNAHQLVALGERVLAFGGADDARVRGELYELRGTAWRGVAATNEPNPRTFPVLVAREHDAVLFGGNPVLFGADRAPDLLGDTWTFDGGWQQHAVAGPPPRAEAAAAYDRHRGRVVLFGGYRRDGDRIVALDDLWEWDGTRWYERRSVGARPSARHGAAMAYDDVRRAIVVFGGSAEHTPLGDTWTWDGERWRSIDATAPPVYGAVSAWDAQGAQVIRFGGWNGERRLGETWAWRGERWRRVASDGPSPRNHTAITATPAGLVLVGGHDGEHVFGDVWVWRDGAWSPRCAAAPRTRIANGH